MVSKVETILLKNLSKRTFNFANALPVLEPGKVVRFPKSAFTIAPSILALISRGDLKEVSEKADADISEVTTKEDTTEEAEEL